MWEEQKAQDALYNAGVFRDGLGQYKQALKNREKYLELWPKSKDAEAVTKSIIDLSDPANSESGDSWLGLGPPLVIGISFMVLGVILMIFWRLAGHQDFFGRRTETADPALLEASGAIPEGS